MRFFNSRTGIINTDDNAQRKAKMTSYLAAQYAAGTPVVAHYPLATPIRTNLTDTAEGQSAIAALKTHYPYTEISTAAEIKPVPSAKIKQWATSFPTSTWADIQRIVRLGLAPAFFDVGQQLTVNHDRYGAMSWDILGFDCDTPADGIHTHSMTVQAHDAYDGLIFDAPEALYYAETELAPGTYNFTLLAGYDEAYGGGKTYQFTLAQAVPAGGQITFPWAYGIQASAVSISTYASATSTTVIETVSVAEGSEGTALTGTNHTHRIRYGSNRWSQSSVRQWLNSSEAANGWWTPTNNFDRPTAQVSKAGFLNGLDGDFLAVVGNVTKRTALSTVTNGGGYEDLTERMFLLSKSEVYGGDENSVNGGSPYPFYENNSALSSAGTGVDSNRIKYKNGTEAYWWLRSCFSGNGYDVLRVYPAGDIYDINASSTYGIVPACCIV